MTVLWVALGAVLGAGVMWWALRVRTAPDAAIAEPLVSSTPEPADERLIEALDALAVGVVVGDTAGDVLYRNRAASEIVGAAHADVLVDEAVGKQLRAALAGERNRQVLDLLGPPRAVVVVSGSLLNGAGAVVTVENVTEQARIDAVRTDFVANVSHELKTPLGAMAVLAETLLDERDPEVIARFAAKLVDEAHRMSRTIDDLLELSRIELGGQPVQEPADLSTVVAEAVERAKPLAQGRSIRFDTEVAAGSVIGDARQLVSAIGNLVENAVKYSDDGATVAVRTSSSDGNVVIEVTDSGIGIPAKDLDRVFERFYRVDRARSRVTGGTGLGLAIVRHVATNHGGDVTVTSREGEGSTFRLTIPQEVTS